MKEKKLNVKKVVAVLVLVVLIAVLTKLITNRKEATYVSSDGANTSLNVAESGNRQENVWQFNSMNRSAEENTNQGTAENTPSENNDKSNDNSVEQNTSTNQVEQKDISADNTMTDTNTSTNTGSSENPSKADKSSDVDGVIWLTFDDGPSSSITPKILDILKKENIKATFFVLNYSDSNEALIKREVEEGHTIGIHGYSHEYSKIYKSKEAFWDNVYKLQDKIEKSTGVKTMHTRFPGGSSNTVSRKYTKGIMTDLTKEMISKGFKYYDWNISSGDAGGAKTSSAVYKNVTKNLSKKRGNMVLCHDFSGNKKTLEALPDIIAYGKKNGYKFAAIDDNTPMYAQHVNN